MDDEEDDFYDPVDAVPPTQSQNQPQNAAAGQPQESDYMDEDEVEEEEDDVCLPLTHSRPFTVLILSIGRFQYYHRGTGRRTSSRTVS